MKSINVKCPNCNRSVRTYEAASIAACVCGHRIRRDSFAFAPVSPKTDRPRNAWRALHRYAWKRKDQWNPDAARQWYADWLGSIPSINCSCKKHWLTQTATLPPTFASPHAFAEWAWFQHNAVRNRLGQSSISWDDAVSAATRPTVGFIASAYMTSGGTETFHRSLLPGLKRDDRLWVDGFVVTGEYNQGDLSLLGVSAGRGVDAAKRLADRCDVLVTWGISDLSEIVSSSQAVIATHHSDRKSTWSTDTITANKRYIDRAVCVHPEVTSEFLGVPVTLIPNAVDPARYLGNAEGLREQWGIAATDKVHFWCHRLSTEKRPELAVEIANALPEGHVMVIAGEGYYDVPASPKLRYVGRIESPANWFAVASTFLSLSTFDGFGLSVAEAIGAGLAVVSTPVGIAARPGMATTLPVDSSVGDWVSALVNAKPNDAAREIIRTEYAVEPWLRNWADTILSVVPDAY